MKPLENMPDITSAIIDQLEVGICVLDHTGNVTMTNAEFERQSKSYRVFNISPNGRLRLSTGTNCDHIDFFVEQSLRPRSSKRERQKKAILLPADDGAIILCVEIVPVHGRGLDCGRTFDGAVLISRDKTGRNEVDLGLVKQVYSDLTAAELQVIGLICNGLTNVEIAERRCRSVMTINSQVKSILEKSGASNRTQLVSHLGNFSLQTVPTSNIVHGAKH